MYEKTNVAMMVIALLLVIPSCKNLTTCDGIEKSEMMMLMDVSDNDLFFDIQKDLKNNFSSFMMQTQFAEVTECQEVKMSIGNLSGRDELQIKSISIGIDQKGLSGAEKRKRGSPAPVVQLVRQTIEENDILSSDPDYNSSTNITQTVVKSIIGLEEDTQNTVLIFSDMVVNNKLEGINFYKSIPENIKKTIHKLVDNDLRSKLSTKFENGLEVKVIVVLKGEPKGKVKKKEVKEFWIKGFEELGIQDVQFVDNLSNKIRWD